MVQRHNGPGGRGSTSPNSLASTFTLKNFFLIFLLQRSVLFLNFLRIRWQRIQFFWRIKFFWLFKFFQLFKSFKFFWHLKIIFLTLQIFHIFLTLQNFQTFQIFLTLQILTLLTLFWRITCFWHIKFSDSYKKLFLLSHVFLTHHWCPLQLQRSVLQLFFSKLKILSLSLFSIISGFRPWCLL